MNRLWLMMTLALPLSAVAADNPDASFLQKATQGGLAEIDAGMLAQQKATSAPAKKFGEMMVKDHGAANAGLRDLALADHVDLPSRLTAEQAAARAQLVSLPAEAFDRAYIESQILAHREAIALFKEESASGDDLDAKRFATATLPTLQSHLDILLAIPVVPPNTPSN